MKKNHFILLVLTFIFCPKTHAQTYEQYFQLAKKYTNEGKYEEAAKACSDAFWKNGGAKNVEDRYQCACAFGRANNADSAFAYIEKLVTRSKFYDIDRIESESAFGMFHDDVRWSKYCDQIRVLGTKMNIPLAKELEVILVTDQAVRGNGENLYGLTQQEMDVKNMKRVSEILDTYGWLGEEEVGSKGNHALFLVVQHADLQDQLKYLPMMRQAVKDKKAEASQLALLIDRTNMYQDKKQIYGSQIRFITDADGNKKHSIYAIEDPANVDVRRAEVGLGPLADYLLRFGVVWNLEEHIKEQEKKK
jgi:hypothetical protein